MFTVRYGLGIKIKFRDFSSHLINQEISGSKITENSVLKSSPLCILPCQQHVPKIMKYPAHYLAW